MHIKMPTAYVPRKFLFINHSRRTYLMGPIVRQTGLYFPHDFTIYRDLVCQNVLLAISFTFRVVPDSEVKP